MGRAVEALKRLPGLLWILVPTWPERREFWTGFWPAIISTFFGAVLAIWAGLQVAKSDRERDRLEKEGAVLPQLCRELGKSAQPLHDIAARDPHPTSPVQYRILSATIWDATTKSQLVQAIEDSDLIFKIATAYSLLNEVNQYIVRYQEFSCSISASVQCAEIITFVTQSAGEAGRNVKYAMDEIGKYQKKHHRAADDCDTGP